VYSVVLTTTASLKEARHILQGLHKERLIACGNILDSIESHFAWKKKLCVEKECLVLIKTKKSQFPKVRDFILKNHSYEVPEIIMVPVEKGFKNYLKWINEVVS
jgi:periplasmic divalent cation tolerance protein